MAKPLCVERDGATAAFSLKPVDRAKIYGKRRRVAMDEQGNPCSRASLLVDGSLLLKSGMTGQGYFLPDGQFVKQSELEGLDDDGTPLQKVPSTLGVAQALEGPIDPSEVLDLRVQTIYELQPEDADSSLVKQLTAGHIFRCAFNYRDDYRAETAVLVANDNGFFALVGQPVTFQWSALATVTDLPAVDLDDDDDLDFEF